MWRGKTFAAMSMATSFIQSSIPRKVIEVRSQPSANVFAIRLRDMISAHDRHVL
jgi:hypothetical protein